MSSASRRMEKLSLKRRVQFSEAIVVGHVPSRQDFKASDYFDRWWSPDEFRAIRLAAKLACKEILREEGGRVINDYDEAILRLPALVQELTEEDIISAYRNPSKHAAAFEKWATHPLCGRGLEKYSSKAQKIKRRDNIMESTSNVIVSQASSKSAEELAALYRETTIEASIFARMLGHSDEVAVLEMKKETEEVEPRRPHMVKQVSRSQLLIRQQSVRKINQLDL